MYDEKLWSGGQRDNLAGMESMRLVHKMAVAITWACFVIGLGLLACSYGFYHHSRNFLAICSRADGTIVENVSHSDSDNNLTYAPRFSFQTPDGTTHTLLSSSSSSPPSYSVGEHVQVLYMPDKPGDAILNSYSELWLGTTVFAVLAGGAWFGALVWLLIDRFYIVRRLPSKTA